MDMQTVGIMDFADGCPGSSGLDRAYTAGIRVAAGYRGSTAWKKLTPTVRDRLRNRAKPFGIVAMFEADDPTVGYFRANGGRPNGVADGQAAREDWRSIGYPDSCFIAYAYDGNTGPGNYAPIKAYFQGVNAVDTCKPWAYIEPDVGELLYADGLIAGIFAPAAYAWDPAGKDGWDRPHVYWIQQHNGVTTYGGNVDVGVIRADANLWWPSGHTGPIMGDDAVTPDDVAVFANTDGKFSNYTWASDLKDNEWITLNTKIQRAGDEAHVAHTNTTSLGTKVDAIAAKIDAIQVGGVDLDALAGKVADLLAARLQS